MDIKKDQINKAVEECENTGANVRYSGAVLKIHDTKKGSAKRILIVTNLFITYYKTGSKPVEDRKNYWRNVSSFNYEDKRIELYFDKSPFRFISDNSDEIFDVIMEIFLRCFTPDELAPLDLSRYAHPPIKINGYGILNRYSIITASLDTEKNQNELEEVKLLVKYSKPTFEIQGAFKNVDAVLETVRAAPYLNILTFPKTQKTKNLYKIIANFLQKPSNVQMISLFNRPDENFDYLSKSKTESGSNKKKIAALKFTDVEIEENDLERLKNYIISESIDSLSLCHSLSPRLLQKFSTNFLGSEVMSKLSYLCLDGTKKLKFKNIVSKLSNISILSLRGCNLEISSVFMSLARAKIQSLRYLNLSHNKCSFCSKKFRIPPYLERIDLNSVEWTNSTLAVFLAQLFNQQLNEGLKLYINKINIDDNEWESVFDTFESITKYPLTELSWNHNKLSQKLFNFISNNIQISNIFMNGCFKHNDEKEIREFAKILPNLTNCTHLVIRGDSDSFTLKGKSKILFEYIKQMKSISYIDFSNNNISAGGIEGIAELANECPRLTHISFDGSKFENKECFEKLIDEGEKRRRPLYISWPENDLNNLLNNEQIDETNIQIYKDRLNHLSTGISNSRTNAIRSSMQIISNMATNSKSSRMSMRMLKTENSVALKEKKSHRSRSTVRDIRTGSFRGVKRPNLLLNEKSHMEYDPNSPLNKTFEVYKSYFTHKFPMYYTQNLKNIFACNPIELQELDDISFSEDEEIEESSEDINDNTNTHSDHSSRSVKANSIRDINVDIQDINDDEEEEIIELALLNDPEIPLIRPLNLPQSIYRKNIYNEQKLNNQSNSQLLTKILNLPKLQKLKNNDEYSINNDNEIDRSSLKINEKTKELEIFKSEMKVDEISDFSSSGDLEDDNSDDINLDNMKTLINQIKNEIDL